jgi:hypothetical protein
VPRRQLGNIASENGDRQFTSILQSFLHEYGNITLRPMKIIYPPWQDMVDTIPIAAVFELGWEYKPGRCVRNVIFINLVHQTYHFLLEKMETCGFAVAGLANAEQYQKF